MYALEKCQLPPIDERDLKSYSCVVKTEKAEPLEFTIVRPGTANHKPGTILLKKNGKSHVINFNDYSEEVDNLFADVIGDLLVVFCELGDVEASSSYAAAYSIPDFKRKWIINNFAGFSLHVVRKGNFAFVSTVGFAAKLDMRSGKFSWRHKDLYKSRGFNGGKPTIDKGEVKFSNSQGKDLIINEKTGKILN